MNDKVYFFRGWKLKMVDGVIKGFVGNIFGDASAVVLVTKSESKSCKVGRYVTVSVEELNRVAN